MTQRSVRILLGVGACLAMFGLGVLGGAVIERTWYAPGRTVMLEQLEGTIRAYEALEMAGEPGGLPEAPRLNLAPRSPR